MDSLKFKSKKLQQTDLYAQTHIILCGVDRVTAKVNTTIYLNAELINLAKELGLNISKTCENDLKLAISRLQGTNPELTGATPQLGSEFSQVDRAGFEP